MEYITVQKASNDEFVEKRSRFIGYISPVKTEQEAVEFIKTIKSKHWDATHNVYAYSLREGNIFRYSDDGEPQGTAGIPVLDVLRKKGITDAVVVVTRYFGGIMLGAGGLVRAYTKGAVVAVTAGVPICMRECLLCRLECDYTFYGRAAALIPECGGVIDDTAFAENVCVDFHIEGALLGALQKKITDASCGTLTVQRLSSAFFEFAVE